MNLSDRSGPGRPFLHRFGLRALLIASLAFLAVGCSRLSLIYGFAESALEEQAAFHLDLDEADQALVDRKIDELLAWHSAEMLPRYARFMNAQADLVANERVSRATVGVAIRTLRTLLDDLVKGAAPHVAAVLVDHTAPEKLRYLEARMTERLEERREELAEPAAERLQSRIERVVENFERLTGDLDEAQIEMIRRYAVQTTGANRRWLETRASRQQAFLNFLSQQPTRTEIDGFIFKIMLRGHDVVDPDYQAISEARWRAFEALLTDIMTSLSPEQRATVTETLREYAAELLALSG